MAQWATEEIITEEYNPVWPLMASILMRELKSLHDFKGGQFEHIGSTAVPDLAAKPIIDLMLVVDNFDDVDMIQAALEPESWQLIPPELTDKVYRRTFVKVVKDKCFAHFHLTLNRENEMTRNIAFRDLLRQNDVLANEYARLKMELAEKFRNDREGYSNAKTEFVNATLRVKDDKAI